MPELPEVETTRRGIEPLVVNKIIDHVHIYNASLRWPVTDELRDVLPGQKISSVGRRSKYLLFYLDRGTLIVHLGMTGHLRLDRNLRLIHYVPQLQIFCGNGVSKRSNTSPLSVGHKIFV